MSRPNISYPHQVQAGPSNYATSPPSEGYGPRRSSLQQASRQLSGPRPGPNALDSSITRLLVVTKQLLQGLEQWSQGYLTEENVSDIYVRLGDGFETCVGAFHRVGIQTKELDNIPSDLRICLEQCLAEEPSIESLNQYLPDIRQIIYNLLNGLKGKQQQYKSRLANGTASQIDISTPPPQTAVKVPSTQPPRSIPNLGQGIGSDDRLSIRSVGSATSGISGISNKSGGMVSSASRDRDKIPAEGGGGMYSNDNGSEVIIPASSSMGKVPSASALAERAERDQRRQASDRNQRPPPADAFRPPRRTTSEGSSTGRITPSPTNQLPPLPPIPSQLQHHQQQIGTPRMDQTTPTLSQSRSLSESISSRGIQLKDDGPVPSPPSTSTSFPSNITTKPPPRPERSSRGGGGGGANERDSFSGTGGRVSRFSADSDITNSQSHGSPHNRSMNQSSKSPPIHIQPLTEVEETGLATGMSTITSFSAMVDAPSLPQLDLPTTSLSPDLSEQEQSSSNKLGIPDIPPESHKTLAALRGFDALERRASKRYSSYTFNKMLPISPNSGGKKGPISNQGNGDSAINGISPQRPARRGGPEREREKIPPMPPLPERSSLRESAEFSSDSFNQDTKGKRVSGMFSTAADNKEEIERPSSAMSNKSSTSMRIIKTPETSPSSRKDEPPTLTLEQATPRPPPLNRSTTQSSTTSISTSNSTANLTFGDRASSPIPPSASQSQLDLQSPKKNGKFTVYLKLGRQTKKANVKLPMTLESLRLMFMEKFEYDPGLEDFPDVYCRDSKTGVEYELEDMDDLREGIILSLNIEPLDQVKQHFDHTFAGLMSEVREMKKALDHSRRMSTMPASISHLTVSATQSPALPSRTTLPSLPSPTAKTSGRSPPSPRLPPSSPSPKPATGAAAIPSHPLDPSRMSELTKQQDELLSLRRDLAIMRQIHSDFLVETKESFSALRTQNNSMKEVIKTKIGGSRALLDNSKLKLESQCSDTITAVEEIQDIIDNAREDAYRRYITPSSLQMKKIRQELNKAIKLADEFAKDVNNVEATWRATWAQELSRVMEEQKLLAHQIKLGEDLRSDISDAEKMWINVEDFVKQRIQANPNSSLTDSNGEPGVGGIGQKVVLRGFRPPTPDDDDPASGRNNLLMEIRTKEADPQSRLKAIEAQAKARERERLEKLNENNEFADELSGFVSGRKLRKTGGTEEVERYRARKSENTLKKMLSSQNQVVPSTGSASPKTTTNMNMATTTSVTGNKDGSRDSSAGNSLKSPVFHSPAKSVSSPKATE